MMSINNENYVNDVNGAIFTSGTSSGRGAPRNSQVVIQRNPYGVRVLGRGARSKNKRQSPPASPSGSSTNVPATRLERRMEAAQSIRTLRKNTLSNCLIVLNSRPSGSSSQGFPAGTLLIHMLKSKQMTKTPYQNWC